MQEYPNKNPFEESVNFNKIFDTKFYKENKSIKSLNSFLESLSSVNEAGDMEDEKLSESAGVKVNVIADNEGTVYGVYDQNSQEMMGDAEEISSNNVGLIIEVLEVEMNKLYPKGEVGSVAEFKGGKNLHESEEEDLEEGVSDVIKMIPDNVISKIGSVIAELLDNEKVNSSKVSKLQNAMEKKIRRKSPDVKDFIMDAISTGNFNLGEVLVATILSIKAGNN